MPNRKKSGLSELGGLAGYAATASTPVMRAIARIALARGHTQTSLAEALAVHSSNVRRHFKGKTRQGTIDFYVSKLGRNDFERRIIREYLDIVDGRFDMHSAREGLMADLYARELELSDGGLPGLLSALNALDDSVLAPALQAYLQADREERLALVESTPAVRAFMLSFVGRKLGLAFAVLSSALREYVNVEAFLAPERTPAENCLWLLWSHLRMPDSPFTDDDREALIDLAAGRLQRRGADTASMLRYVERQRECDAREAALRQPIIATTSLNPRSKKGKP